MALPLIPATEIPGVSTDLRRKAVTHALCALFDYVDSTRVSSNAWSPSTWSAFRRPVRKNNDVDGWHNRLKRQARSSHLPLYVLIRLLHDEGQVCELHLKLVSDRKLTKTQKNKYKELHSRVNSFWGDFDSGAKSAKKTAMGLRFRLWPC